MTQVAHHAQVQHGWTAMVAHPLREILRDLEHELRVVARGVLVAKRVARAQGGLHPALRRAHDAGARRCRAARP